MGRQDAEKGIMSNLTSEIKLANRFAKFKTKSMSAN